MSRQVSGGGREVDVAPERLERWLSGFVDRHGAVSLHTDGERVVATAQDGAVAEAAVPFPPLPLPAPHPWAALAAHASLERRVGVLLVRLGGFAVGVLQGPELVVSKVGSRPVHGRAKPGGSSAARFARRREGQARVALGAAADTAARLLLPAAPSLHAVVLGGDRGAARAVLDDPRLAPLRGLALDRVLDVPEPRRHVLDAVAVQVRAVRVRVRDPV